jgi:hypothetical protein
VPRIRIGHRHEHRRKHRKKTGHESRRSTISRASKRQQVDVGASDLCMLDLPDDIAGLLGLLPTVIHSAFLGTHSQRLGPPASGRQVMHGNANGPTHLLSWRRDSTSRLPLEARSSKLEARISKPLHETEGRNSRDFVSCLWF